MASRTVRIRVIGHAVSALALMAAGEAAFAQTWSFEQVARQALATHPAILSRQSSSVAAKADLDGANWQRYPTPSIEGGNDTHNTRSGLFRLEQPVWSGGRITAGIDGAQARLQASETSITEAKQDVLLRVIAAYVEALRQQARRDTLAKAVRQHERLLGLIHRRVEQEASPLVDQQLAQSRLFQANNDLSTVNQALANALTQLSQLAGKPIASISPLDSDNLVAPDSIESVLQRAIARSPTLQRLTFEEQAAQADVDLKKASYLPQLALRLEHGYASAPLNGIPPYTTNRVMIVLAAQPGAGLSALAGVDAAAAKREAARQQREAALRDLQERLTVDWDELVAARARLTNASLASQSSQEVYESYERQYTAGRKTWLDLLNTVRESTQSEVAVGEERTQVTGATLRLEVVTGELMGLLK